MLVKSSGMMKIYSISLLALRNETNATGERLTIYEHLPGLQPAESIDAAAAAAKIVALNRWPPSAGWHSHQALIQSVARRFFRLADEARAAGMIDETESEELRPFYFDEEELDAEILS